MKPPETVVDVVLLTVNPETVGARLVVGVGAVPLDNKAANLSFTRLASYFVICRGP